MVLYQCIVIPTVIAMCYGMAMGSCMVIIQVFLNNKFVDQWANEASRHGIVSMYSSWNSDSNGLWHGNGNKFVDQWTKEASRHGSISLYSNSNMHINVLWHGNGLMHGNYTF